MSDSSPPRPVDLSLIGPEHVRRYLETGGEVGYLWNGAPTLLLTTRGRKSGQWRTTPMIFTRVGDRIVVIASNGGAPSHPAWFLNLEATPDVWVQIRTERFPVIARIADSPERERLWAEAVKGWHFNRYEERTTRRIPVVILERTAKAPGA
jgi:deazaflavin-dependent oxidoreductase (nitroreductase family)